jgi:hypothetical protein
METSLTWLIAVPLQIGQNVTVMSLDRLPGGS